MPGVKGMKRYKSHNKKISKALKGKKKSAEHALKISIKAKERCKNPLNNSNYKGDKVGYIGIHIWLRKTYGYPFSCEKCNMNGIKKNNKWNIAWALKKGFGYERKRENFFALCNKCHRSYDNSEKWKKAIRERARDKLGKFL